MGCHAGRCSYDNINCCIGHIPVSSSSPFLDSVQWKRRHLHSHEDRSRYSLGTFDHQLLRGLDFSNASRVYGLVFGYESTNKIILGRHSCPGSLVSLESSFASCIQAVLIKCRGSSATIIRCIYVKGLAEDDFLWQTVGISIWSIVEVGVGATAASLATLRPLFVRFFSRSHLFRGSETLPSTFPRGPSPPTNISVTKSGLSNWRRSCVIESSSPTKPDALTVELSLREDVRKGHGVTTVINSDWKDQSEKELAIEDNGEAPVHRSLRRYRGDRGSHSGRRGLLRSLSQTGLREPEEAIISPTWGENGIRKTMVVTTDSELGDQVPGTAL